MVNKSSFLDEKTIILLRKMNESIMRKQDRAFLIGGTYAIAPDSVVPVSFHWLTVVLIKSNIRDYSLTVRFLYCFQFLTFLGTGIIFLNRMLTDI